MERIGPYKISHLIEEGGVAAVYRGVQESLERPVAVKVLQHRFSGDSRIVDYFNRESLIIARLNHPNIIHVIDRGLTDDGRPYFVMEYIDGTHAARLIMEGALTFEKKLDILIQTCKALAYAHKNGVIHRDIKPANILVDHEGNVHVADFGIAQFYDGNGDGASESRAERLGTPSYMSPEQLRDSRSVCFASDIYSLGVVMVEMFTGRRFPKNHVLPSPLAPEVPEALDQMIRQCVEPLPHNRPASVELIKTRLFMLSQGAHIGAGRRQQAMGDVPAMYDIFTVLDILRETDKGATYLVRHKHKSQLLVARTFRAMNGGMKAAGLLMNLQHEHIAAVQGVSGNKDSHIVVMEYLPGGSLADRLASPLPFQEAVRIIEGVCKALQFAHAHRITHGNLTTSNVLFTQDDEVKISDFRMNDSGDDTGSGDFSERIRCDIRACGTLLYAMIMGVDAAYDESTPASGKALKALPRNVRHLVLRLLSTRDDTRFMTMKQAVAAIVRVQGDHSLADRTVMDSDKTVINTRRDDCGCVLGSRKFWQIAGMAFSAIVLIVFVLVFLT